MGVTIRDVAKLAGTSVTAVSATLNGARGGTIRVGEATRERIYAAAAQLGYVPNPIAKSLATGKTKVLGLMLPYANAFVDQDPFCNQVMSGVVKEVVDRHYNLMLYTATSGIDFDQAALTVDSRIEGLILVMPPAQSSIFLKCRRRNIPFVSVLQEPVPGDWAVNSDDYTGGRLAAKHLLNLGHTKIAHLRGLSDVVTSSPRERGFRDILDEAGVEVREELVIPAGFNWELGQAATDRLLALDRSRRPTAIFAANDLCAEGAMRAVRQAGMKVPDDVAVVGYDDTWFATMTQPPLTSVHMPIVEMGEMAARMLIARLEGEKQIDPQPVLPVSLTVRHSCGSAAPLSQETAPSPPALQ